MFAQGGRSRLRQDLQGAPVFNSEIPNPGAAQHIQMRPAANFFPEVMRNRPHIGPLATGD